MKVLKFRTQFIENILLGEKQTTWRLFDDKELQVGNTVSLVDNTSQREFAVGEIVAVRTKSLGEINEEDYAEGHGRYESEEAMLGDYRKYYGNEVGLNSPLKIIKFRLL